MIISAAKLVDLADILSLEKSGFLAKEQWSEKSWQEEITAEGRLVIVAKDANLVSGVASFRLTADTVELLRIIVHPSSRRKKYGSKMLMVGHDWALTMEASQIWLEVAKDNTSAEKLYKKHGFTQVTVRKDYYGAGKDAIVMGLALNKEECYV